MSRVPAAVVHERLITALTDRLPSLSRPEALAAVRVANVHRHTGLRTVEAHVSGHPDCLVSGSGHVPISMFRLLVELEAREYPVRVPHCGDCNRRRVLRERDAEGGLICVGCAQQARARRCYRCGTHARVAVIEADGPLCQSCYARDPDRHEACIGCGRHRKVQHRRPDGAPLCSSCHEKPHRVCTFCGSTRPASARTPSGPACTRCYDRHVRELQQCGQCGRTARIQRRPRGTGPALCRRCAPEPIALCGGCDQERPCINVAAGTPLCVSCRPRRVTPCARCGQSQPVVAQWPMGPVCRACYRHTRAHPAPCSACTQRRALVGFDTTGQLVCGPCAGSVATYLCQRCGGGEERFHDGLCVRCVTVDRLHQQFGSADGAVPDCLSALLVALARANRPRSVLEWLRRDNGGAAVLRDLAARHVEPSHDELDRWPEKSVAALRAMLVHSGALPARHEYLDRLPAWLTHQLPHLPEQHRQIINVYTTWSLLHRARRRAAHAPFTEFSAANLRARVMIAIALLRWLHEQELTLHDLDQPRLDRWLDEGPKSRSIAGDFLGWATARRLTPELTVPRWRDPEPDLSFTDEQRWDLLRQCLHHQLMPRDIRAAGALVLLFGLPVSRIVELTVDHIVSSGPDRFIIVQGQRTLLPPPLHALLAELPEQTRSIATSVGAGSAQLFPGAHAGRPATAAGLTAKLRRHGIAVRRCRNAALIALAADIPAAALSPLLGISIGTAVRWTRRAQRDWHSFVRARATTD